MTEATETNAIVRELVSTSQKKVSKAVFGDYNLTFTVESTEGEVKKVEVNGSRTSGAAPGMINFQGSVNEKGTVAFNPLQGDVSPEDSAVIINEMLAIKGGAAE